MIVGRTQRGKEDEGEKKIKDSLTNSQQQPNCAGERLTRNSKKRRKANCIYLRKIHHCYKYRSTKIHFKKNVSFND